jgi:branched-chain amino acid transport system substrate-binding protein
MWKRILATGALAVLAMGLQGNAHAQSDEVVVGMLLAMSGQGITYGKVMSQGALLAAEEINAQGGIGGKKLRIEIGDHKSGEVKAATSEVQRLVNLYKTSVILSSYSAPTVAAQAMAADLDLVLVNGGGWSPALVGKPRLWNTRLTGDATATAALRVAWEDGARTLCMIYRQDPSGIDTAKVAGAFWTSLGGKVVCEEKYDINATNFSSQIAKIRGSKPDALIAYSYGQVHGILIKQARDFGYSGPLYGIEFLPENLTVAGAAIEGYKFAVDEFDVKSTEPASAKFVAAYRARYKEDPDFYAANYYEATYMLRDVIVALQKEGKPATGTNIDAKLRQMRTFPSVYGGTMTLLDNGTVKKPIAVFQIKNGQRTLLKRLTD